MMENITQWTNVLPVYVIHKEFSRFKPGENVVPGHFDGVHCNFPPSWRSLLEDYGNDCHPNVMEQQYFQPFEIQRTLWKYYRSLYL